MFLRSVCALMLFFFYKSKIYSLGNMPLKCQINPEHYDFRIMGSWIKGILLCLLVAKSTMQKYCQNHTWATFT